MKFATNTMDGASLGELILEEYLLDLLGAGYTRVLLVYLSPNASLRWKMKATRVVNDGSQTPDEDWEMEDAPHRRDTISGPQAEKEEGMGCLWEHKVAN